jgi:bifunctional UDP-N-acetylglucosamine pyrophosphorylase/glucosamine-1-phosphate N-acetyltransferase
MKFELNKETRLGILERHRENGVEIPLEDGIIIGPEVVIGAGTLILPGTILLGRTVIGENCELGPNSYITDSEIGANCRVIATFIELSVLESDVKIGPMSNVRPNCRVGAGAKIGDFVELKNTNLGEDTSVAHLTYIGDSDVGARCNFGCGVVTVNYDGSVKSRTTIGDGVFIGCNTNLIAPVKMGDGSYSAAGTTVTGDIPEDALVIGRARQEIKEGRARGRYKKR